MVSELLGLQFGNACDSMYNESLRVVFEKYINRLDLYKAQPKKERNRSLKDEKVTRANKFGKWKYEQGIT